MLQAISWKLFLTWMGIATGVYYAWLLYKYAALFRGGNGDRNKHAFAVDDFGGFEKRSDEAKTAAKAIPVAPAPQQMELALMEKAPDQKPAEEPPAKQAETVEQPEKKEPPLAIDLAPLANRLAEEANALIGQMNANKQIEQEIKFALQRLLDKEEYRVMKGTAVQEMVNQHIGSVLEKECSIHLDAVGLGSLWAK